MDKPNKRINARFFRTDRGNEPVREWLQSLGKNDRIAVGVDIFTCESGWPKGLPVCRSLGKGLFEVRSELENNRISRVFFFVSSGLMFLLHAFFKTTKTTPKTDLDLARRRMAEQLQRITAES